MLRSASLERRIVVASFLKCLAKHVFNGLFYSDLINEKRRGRILWSTPILRLVVAARRSRAKQRVKKGGLEAATAVVVKKKRPQMVFEIRAAVESCVCLLSDQKRSALEVSSTHYLGQHFPNCQSMFTSH